MVVFEKNGLVFSRTTMSHHWKKITSLSFSSDSQIMGVCGLYARAEERSTNDDAGNNEDEDEDDDDDDDGHDDNDSGGVRGRIELWSLRNAHWYVHWARASSHAEPPHCKFSPEDPRALVYNDSKTARCEPRPRLSLREREENDDYHHYHYYSNHRRKAHPTRLFFFSNSTLRV